MYDLRMLDASTHKYSYRLPSTEDSEGYYMPQVVIDSVLSETKPIAKELFENRLRSERLGDASPSLSRHRVLITEPRVSIDLSKNLVINAFQHFDPALGEKARKVFDDVKRLKLEQVPLGEAGGHNSITGTEDNPNPYAIIHYRYDNTISDAVYLAHELGHLIADDLAVQSGMHPKSHMFEIQGFLTQNILYDYLINHQPDGELQEAAREHFNAEITRAIYTLPKALGALHAERVVERNNGNVLPEEAEKTFSIINHDWLGENWRAFNSANYVSEHLKDPKERGYCISELHKHSMASIVATSLFDYANQSEPSNKSKILMAVLGEESHEGLITTLEKLGISSEEDLNRFIGLGVNRIQQNAEPQSKENFFDKIYDMFSVAGLNR